jgi:hypothetical protein
MKQANANEKNFSVVKHEKELKTVTRNVLAGKE